jgi:hypothetical protein
MAPGHLGEQRTNRCRKQRRRDAKWPIWFDDLQLWCNGGCLMTFLRSCFELPLPY